MLPSSILHFTHKHIKDDSIGYSARIDTIEDTLRALSLLLPGRFEDGDFCSQAILAGLNLVSLFHTNFLVRKSLAANHTFSFTDNQLSFNERFLQFNQAKRSTAAASWILSIISYSEVILEMILSRRVSKIARWKWIASLEGLKSILRLVVFYSANKHMILHPTHFIRNVDPVSLDVCEEDKFELLTLDPRTGTALSATTTTYNSDSATAATAAVANDSRRTRWGKIGEILWIIRPFIYAFMIMLEQRNKRNSASKLIRHDEKEGCESDQDDDESIEKYEEGSWKPWLISLAIDIMAKIARNMQHMSNLERDESKRRDYLFIYYLFRGPIYLKFTRLLLDKFCDATEHRPLISIITAAINDYRPFWEESYFYTAGS